METSYIRRVYTIMTHLCFTCVNQDKKTDDYTSVWTRVKVTGTIFDAETIAVFAPILRNWVVALSFCQLNSSAAGSRTISKGAPLAPPSVHLRQDNIVDMVDQPEVTQKYKLRKVGHHCSSSSTLR